MNSLQKSFSIPNRIEPSATRRDRVHAGERGSFQYPQSDRALCNQVDTKVYVRQVPTFSIPNRIEPSATTSSQPPATPDHRFQYPQSDRALCNCVREVRAVAKDMLSVSPIGSSPLQRLPVCA